MKTGLLIAVALGGAAVSTQALAWHNKGHMIVAAYAWRSMDSGARCTAWRLLGSNPTYAEETVKITDAGSIPEGQALFMHTATWPDRIKNSSNFKADEDSVPKPGTDGYDYRDNNIGLKDPLWTHKYWHYIDYPYPDIKDEHHQPEVPNAETQIPRLAADLSSATTTDDQKAYALAWLIHLVGDVHQPLHASEQWRGAFATSGDRGGNSVKICPDSAPSCDLKVLCPPHTKCSLDSLHGFWDAIPGDGYSLRKAVAYLASVTKPSITDGSNSDVHKWTTDSYDIARRHEFTRGVTAGSKGAFKIDNRYRATALVDGNKQLGLAGARLATLLNGALKADNTCAADKIAVLDH